MIRFLRAFDPVYFVAWLLLCSFLYIILFVWWFREVGRWLSHLTQS